VSGRRRGRRRRTSRGSGRRPAPRRSRATGRPGRRGRCARGLRRCARVGRRGAAPAGAGRPRRPAGCRRAAPARRTPPRPRARAASSGSSPGSTCPPQGSHSPSLGWRWSITRPSQTTKTATAQSRVGAGERGVRLACPGRPGGSRRQRQGTASVPGRPATTPYRACGVACSTRTVWRPMRSTCTAGTRTVWCWSEWPTRGCRRGRPPSPGRAPRGPRSAGSPRATSASGARPAGPGARS
jgi:hypothetical protein